MVFVCYTVNHLHVDSNTSSGNRTNVYITVIVPLQDGWTAMIPACQKGHEHVVEALPHSWKFSRAEIFANHQQTRQEKNFAIFIFATRSRYLTTPPTISRMEMVTLSVYFNVKTTVRRQHAYQNVSVAVGEKLPCQREGANSEDLFAVAVMTGKYRRSRKISAVCSMHG